MEKPNYIALASLIYIYNYPHMFENLSDHQQSKLINEGFWDQENKRLSEKAYQLLVKLKEA
jgi:hypothetical protein